MNLRITFLFALLLMVSIPAFAGFPVERRAAAETTTLVANEDEAADELVSPAAYALDSQMTALLLWVFLWPFAAHRWYLKSPIGWNILFILTFGGLGIWAIVDLIDIITGNYPGL